MTGGESQRGDTSPVIAGPLPGAHSGSRDAESRVPETLRSVTRQESDLAEAGIPAGVGGRILRVAPQAIQVGPDQRLDVEPSHTQSPPVLSIRSKQATILL